MFRLRHLLSLAALAVALAYGAPAPAQNARQQTKINLS